MSAGRIDATKPNKNHMKMYRTVGGQLSYIFL